jgi:hypothetical protein
MKKEVFVYRIDKEDIITSVSENWMSFAVDNGWSDQSGSEYVVGHPLWDFIYGTETRHLYQEIFKKVRDGKSVGSIPFRCDSPNKRRFLHLLLTPWPDGQIVITSTIVKTESREPVNLIDQKEKRTNKLINICSMCKKIKLSQNKWIEIEEGIAQLKIFEAEKLPGLTHGLCPACYQKVMETIKKA